jgi:uncharacterized membrane protein
MTLPPLVIFHICAGATGILVGSAALLLKKGSRRHRRAGTLFFIAMLSMCASAVYMATFVNPNVANVIVGTLTAYLVASAWLTVLRRDGRTGLIELALLAVALVDGIAAYGVGWAAAHSAAAPDPAAPTAAYFVFGSIALLGAALDARMLVRGGVSGHARIARHLWRMCVALLIAASSLFLGQQQVFPELIRASGLLPVPSIAIAGLTLFWLCRVLFTDLYKRSPTPRNARGAGVRRERNPVLFGEPAEPG